MTAANKAAEQLEHDEQRQRSVEQWRERDLSTQKQMAKRSLLQRLRDGWVSMRKAAQEQKAERERLQQLQRGRAQVQRDEQAAQNAVWSPPARSYAFLEFFGHLMFLASIVGCIAAGFMMLAGMAEKGPQTVITGIMLLVSSVAGVTAGLLIRMAINVAGDIEDTKKHMATIDQYFRYRNSRENIA